MFRIDSTGTAVALPAPAAVGGVIGYFTKGNPTLSIPPTVVSDDWLNMVQEEIVNVITAAGLTPSKTTYTQLRDAIALGLTDNVTELAIANNASNTALTDMAWDGVTTRSVELSYSIYRKTDTPLEVEAMGKLLLLYKPVANTWDLIEPGENGDDCGVTFNILQTATSVQLRYDSTNLAGANYVGQIRIKKAVFVD